MTTTLDVMHIGCSKGWSKLIGFRCTMNQDDHANFHDRFSALKKTGAREMLITQGRGNAYFRAEVGDELDFRNPDMTASGFTAKITSVVNDEYLRFDRDIPERFAKTDAFVFNKSRGTDNILVKDCLYDSCWGRFLMLGHNVTFENCTWRQGIASAVLVQEGLRYGYWAEGFGAGNVVIRGCRFEALQKFNRAGRELFVRESAGGRVARAERREPCLPQQHDRPDAGRSARTALPRQCRRGEADAQRHGDGQSPDRGGGGRPRL